MHALVGLPGFILPFPCRPAWPNCHHCCAQELADQVRYLEDASEGAEPDGDLATLHVALREVVDACDNKAAQLYALQQL